MNSFALELRATLGLSPDASDEAVLEAVRVRAGNDAAAADVVRKAFGDRPFPDVATTAL